MNNDNEFNHVIKKTDRVHTAVIVELTGFNFMVTRFAVRYTRRNTVVYQ